MRIKAKQALQYKPKGRRNIGRPRKRWRDQLHLEDQGKTSTFCPFSLMPQGIVEHCVKPANKIFCAISMISLCLPAYSVERTRVIFISSSITHSHTKSHRVLPLNRCPSHKEVVMFMYQECMVFVLVHPSTTYGNTRYAFFCSLQ